ncbi:MAG: VWA domain-containing protein [Chloracidobacterium sp.]|nr:VWA domain-containing protein [Chloracidobacterium sp.]MDW8217681.1 VWA domain-containing protein [Acidobacteriota bacterium]
MKRLHVVAWLTAALMVTPGVAQDGGRPRTTPPTLPGAGDDIAIVADSRGVVFSVVDERGRIVSNLRAEDFEIYEDGRRQTIDLFRTSNDLPLMLAVLIDVSDSQASLLPVEKRAVDVFFDAFFRPGRDYGALLTFGGEVELVNGLTSHLKSLKTALGRIEREQRFRDEDNATPPLGTALYDALDITARETLDGPTARRVINSGGIRRAIRRAICVLTDGRDTASQLTLERVATNLRRRGIVVYALGMGDRFRFGAVDRDALEHLCALTGGKMFVPTDEAELEQSFKRIVDDLSGQYIALYRPTGPPAAAGQRTVEVRPRDRRLRVFSQTEYSSE